MHTMNMQKFTTPVLSVRGKSGPWSLLKVILTRSGKCLNVSAAGNVLKLNQKW